MAKTSKFELSMTSTYVSDWGVKEGVRELFQNSLDQEIVDQTNTMFYEYDECSEILKIGNLKSYLETKSLLLGMSSKQNDCSTIGQFGEGYKVGTLALIREGKKVIFHNYAKREVWKPRFVNSKRYGVPILTFFVEEKSIWNPPPHNNLVIEIEGITSDEYEEIKESNLHIKRPEEIIPTQYGNILIGEEYCGRVYVNGLFVEEVEGFMFGYDLKPQFVQLGRDRKSVDGWSLKNNTNKMWKTTNSKENKERILLMAKNKMNDVSYLEYENYPENKQIQSGLYEDAYQQFKNEHGDNAIPVTNWTYNEAKERYPNAELVSVSGAYKALIHNSTEFKSKTQQFRVEKILLSEIVTEWVEDLGIYINKEMQNRLDTIIEKIEELE